MKYPYPVKTLELTAQQQPLQMAYMDVAPTTEPNGKTVLLLHGKNFSGAYWQSTIENLTKQGYRVIAPDQIGFGKSSKPAGFQFTFQALANHTKALLDKLDIAEVSVTGHSMGGMLATRFALMYPNAVEKLVLVNPIGLEDWKRTTPYLPIDQAIAQEKQQTPEIVKRYMTAAYFDGKWKAAYDPLLTIQAGWTIGPDADLIAEIDARSSDMVFTQPVLYEFGDLKAPTLLVIGTRDRTAIGRNRAPESLRGDLGRYDRLGKLAADAIPEAKLVELEGIGHVPQFEDFDRYIAALNDFLAEGPPEASRAQ
ncbi:alpha/beta hydrolase [Microbulbifer sp. CAU 1566]|uniref:alpha/beta fold hydrolase n=1 Tax=Microbulbifer sp. CAU 1566 TaxID=2933269 RepID=UPI002006152C|nr:alpha/beta hydrolase [Microbulbifer sp. CAU 1566]MCK7597072.1 alpha/beta hydrolase [Microbulbifer sp. CAU 1566]